MGKLNNVKKNKLVKIKEDSGVSAPTVEKDVIESPKKKSLIGKVQFKANRKYSKSALSKVLIFLEIFVIFVIFFIYFFTMKLPIKAQKDR